jgi:hypothetical protein
MSATYDKDYWVTVATVCPVIAIGVVIALAHWISSQPSLYKEVYADAHRSGGDAVNWQSVNFVDLIYAWAALAPLVAIFILSLLCVEWERNVGDGIIKLFAFLGLSAYFAVTLAVVSADTIITTNRARTSRQKQSQLGD